MSAADDEATNNITTESNYTGLADSPYPENGVNGNHTGQSEYNGPQTNTTKWIYDNVNAVNNGVIGSDGTIYVASYSGNLLYAFNADGTAKWNVTVTGPKGLAIGNNDTIYVVISKGLCAFSSNGTYLWSYNTTTSTSSNSYPIISSDGVIYFGVSNNFYAVKPDGKIKWNYALAKTYRGSAVGSDGTIYVITGGTKTSQLYAFNNDGTVKWNITASGCSNGGIAIGADGTLYSVLSYNMFASSGYLAAFNPADGSLIWNYTDVTTFQCTPIISSDGTIYVETTSTGGNCVYAFTSNGSVKWTYTCSGSIMEKSPVIGADGKLYIGDSSGNVYAINPDGTLNWTYNTGKDFKTAMIGSDGDLYINTAAGIVVFQDLIPGFETIIENNTVTFTDNSTNIPTSWIWDFGDGKISTEQNPTHNYTTPGNYTITLTVSTKYGDTNSTTKTITVGTIDTTAPTVTANPTNGTYNTTQTVSLISDDPTATIYYTTDGTDPTNTSNKYTGPITIDKTTTLKYTATDTAGNWSPINTQTYTILFNNSTGLIYNGPETNTTEWESDIPVNMAVIGSDGIIYTGYSSGYNVVAMYSNGTEKWSSTLPYRIRGLTYGNNETLYVLTQYGLFALNSNNGKNLWNYTTVLPIYVSGNLNPTVDTNGTIYIPLYNKTSTTSMICALNPDGTVKWNAPVTKTVVPGTAIGSDGTVYVRTLNSDYTNTLYALDPNTGTQKWNITLGYGNLVSISTNGTIYIAGTDIFGTNTGVLYAINPADGSQKWNFTLGSGIGVLPTIANDGTIIVSSFGTLYALIDNGTNATVKWTYIDNQINQGYIYAVIGADGTIYTGNGISAGAGTKYGSVYALNPNGTLKWSYNLGISPLYNIIGFNGTLYIVDNNGKLTALQDLSAGFETNINNTTVNFKDTTTNLPTSWIWDFGDGKISTEQNPTHTYTTPGNYTITLTVSTKYGDTNSTTKTIKVGTDDNAPTVTANPTNGTYNTTQTVSLISDDSTATIYYTTDGTDPTGSSTPYTAPLIIDTTTTLKYAAVDPAGNWSPIYTQTYTIQPTIPILTASFTSNVANGTENTIIQFTDTSTGNPTSWYWNFGDGRTSTEQNPSHTYTTPCNYTVSLTVSDENSTNSTISRYILIYGSAAANKFTNPGFENSTSGWTVGSTTNTSNTLSHEGNNSVYFSNTGTSNTNYIFQTVDLTLVDSISFWGYGESASNNYFCVYIDGTQIGDPLPVTAGKWELYAVNTSNYTGLHTINITSYIKGASAFVDDLSVTITQNLANFTTNTTNTANEPLTVQFTDQSLGLITGWAWDFDGDGVTDSTQQNPTHIYTKPGTYPVTLTVTGPYHNSTTTMFDPFIVVGPTNNRTNTIYTTIQEAIDNALDGDTILIGNTSYLETYTENIDVNKRLNIIAIGNVIIKALDANKATITILSNGLGSVINGFTLTGAINSSSIYISALTNATITNNTITGNDIGINIYGNATINNNTITGNHIGVECSGNASAINNNITGNEIGVNSSGNTSIINNNITGNDIGVNVDNGSSSIHFNNIYSNSMYGLKFTGSGVDASNNWWGTNNPLYQNGITSPSTADIYEAQNTTLSIYDPWIMLNATSSNDFVKEGGNSTITVDMTHNSQGQDTSSSGSIPELPVNFNYTLGTLTTNTATVYRGKANTILTGGNTSGTENLAVTVTGYTVTLPVTVDTVAPTVNATPTGGTYSTTQTVTLTSNDPTATIYYTLDNSTPTSSSTKYTGPIVISNITTLRYGAVDPAGNWALYLQNYMFGSGGLANSDWPGFQNDNNHTGQSNYNGPQTNSTKWTYDNLTVYGSAVIGSDGTIYIGGNDGVLYVFSPEGVLKWTWTTRSQIFGSPTIGSDGTIYITNYLNSTTYAISPSGTLLWKYITGDYNLGSSPVIGSDGTIYIAVTNETTGTLYAISPTGTLKWKYTMGLIYGTSPVIGSDGTIYMADYNGIMYALNPDGTLKWSYKLQTQANNPNYVNIRYNSPSIGPDGTIYITNSKTINNGYDVDYWFYLFAIQDNGTSGSLKWIYNTNYSSELSITEPVYGTPAISTTGTIYVVSTSKIYAINSNGNLLWTYDIGGSAGNGLTSAIIGKDGTIYVGSETGLYALTDNGTDAVLKWSYATGSITGSPTIGRDGSLYVGSTKGIFYAFNDIAADFTVKSFAGTALTEQFNGSTTGTPKSWKWDFGDGNTSTEQNPQHTYKKAGNYTITLTVTLTNGTVLTRTKKMNIIEMDITPPTADADLKGGTYEGTQTITLTAEDRSNTTIYYTTDGSDPKTSATRKTYTDPIDLYDTTTLKFIAVDETGNWSPTYIEIYTITHTIYIENASQYTNLNQEIQQIIDNTPSGYNVVFLGTLYENLQLTINHKLNIISNVGTQIITSTPGTAVFLINGIHASGTLIKGFNITTNTNSGILLNNTSNATVSDVQVTSNNGEAITINESYNTTIKNSVFINSLEGIHVINSNNTTISGGIISNNRENGIKISNSNNTTINGVTVTSNGLNSAGSGVLLEGADTTNLLNSNISENWYGVKLTGFNSNTLINGNTIYNNMRDGVRLDGTMENSTISANTISDNENGIHINGAYTNLLIENNLVLFSHLKGSDYYYSGDGLLFGASSNGSNSIFVNHNLFLMNDHRPVETRYGASPTGSKALSPGETYIPGTNLWELWDCNCVDAFDAKLRLVITINDDGTVTLRLYDPVPGREGFVTGIPNFNTLFNYEGLSQTVTACNCKATSSTPLKNLDSMVTVDVYGIIQSQKGSLFKTVMGLGRDLGYAAGEGTGSGNGPGTGTGNNPGSVTGSGTGGTSGGSASGTLSGLTSTLGATAAAAASGTAGSSQGGSTGQNQETTMQELFVDDVIKNSNIWAIVIVALLLILVLGAYYRKDLINMIRKSKK
ncbi:PKD domain-containing protein [Methanobacterium formicicum]|uniref:PKD domain-containing protein n=1 Tax=Methanobacterium formicicum TaxID=2162 RepID=UPI0024128F2E|nr:PKD domain-containing protein [Methanobacterium formicicum]MDG3547182.1 PKD domain-containing protein [Methanobacterium formicicum]